MATPDPRIDAYIAKSAPFARPVLSYLRQVVGLACPEGVETLKWGSPHLTYRGKLVCGMAAFKQHATFGFWHGGQIVGEEAGRADAAMGQFGRLTDVSQLPSQVVLEGYVRQAMRLIDEGGVRKAAKPSPRPALAVPPELAAALAAMPAAKATFDAFPPGQRREYIEWITEAKRDETRQRRLAQAVEWMAEGKSRNWKYVNC